MTESLLSRRLGWQKYERSATSKDLRVHLLASFTINRLAPYLGSSLCAHQFAPSVEVGPFDQITQTLLGQTLTGEADVVVVWTRLEDLWAGSAWPLVDGDVHAANDSLVNVGEMCVQAAVELAATVVVVLPAIPDDVPLGVGDAGNRFGVGAMAAAARELLRAAVSGRPGVLVFDAESAIRELGSRNALDHRMMAAATVPYTEEAFALIGDRIANLIRLDRKGAKKVAVVDADNTLWGGVVGEEGAAGVDLAEQGPGVSYRQFQKYLLDLRRAGAILAVASKNNESDALEVFDRREMRIRLSDLAAWRINWEPKSSNISAMADELNVGTASMVFVDDSAMERAEVAAAVDGIGVLSMPEDPAGWFDAIVRSGMLDRLPPTSSDLTRAESYAQETRRAQVRRTTDLGEFLASLGLEVAIFAPKASDMARLAQLVAKTNQFTLGGARHSESELAAMAALPTHALRLVYAKDNFGDYGVIGALIVSGIGAAQPILDTFVLSCRAMGRGIEDAMLHEAGVLVEAHSSARSLTVTVVNGPKNRPLRTWIAKYGITDVDLQQQKAVTVPEWPSHIVRREPPSADE